VIGGFSYNQWSANGISVYDAQTAAVGAAIGGDYLLSDGLRRSASAGALRHI
jgi:hypothetical protein